GKGRNKSGRWGDKCDKFVNCHDARDGRVDGRGPRRNRDRNRDDRDDRDDRDSRYDRNRNGVDDRYENGTVYDRNRNGVDDRYERRNDGGYYGNNGGYRNNDNYGNIGGSYDLRQTALNAGYNNGMEEGRRDRNNNERFDYSDESAYRSATKDYNSRLGDRSTYQQYFREAFARGYADGYGRY
ncbi:MAG: hypothetical protein LC785_17275, partial [Acidobacteria bacterium]|nr:hypothetical protein [Acidobacteriota bacterium]